MKRLFTLSAGFFLMLCLLGGASCNSQPTAIFLVTLDTTRADHIDYSLTDNVQTPHLAELASRGQYFENAYSLIPITLPSHASMFYSLPPHQLKLYNNGQVQKIAWPTVTQLLKGKGFATGAVISLGVLKAEFGLDKGFDHYVEHFKPYLWSKSAEEVNNDAFRLIRQTLREKPGQTYFFWLHYSDPHEPYFPPDVGGSFRVSLGGEEVFASRSTEQPAVNILVTVPPGQGRIVFKTEVPPTFGRDPGSEVQVQYIKYQDFSLEPEKADFTRDLDITMPVEWNTKKTRAGTNYYSSPGEAEIRIFNHRREPVSLRLRFIYRLSVDDASRKRFYREEIKYLDRQLGQLFRFLKAENLYDDSVLIVMGDHGENLGEYRDYFGHIHFLNPPAVHVPLIIAGKGIKARGKRQEVVTNLNIAPTILDIAGIEKPGFMLGHSLLNTLPRTTPLVATYSPEAYFDAFAIIDYPHQVIFYPGRTREKLEFYDLNQKGQGMDSRDTGGNTRARLTNSVLKIARIITATKGKIGAVSERHQEILKSLGYL
jgi:membrane-anchored protein YejM (alkaline phosphatase superfamily)